MISTMLRDSYNRPIRDLLVSLTDRCNFRCFYCLPHGEPPIAPKEEMLSYEEMAQLCGARPGTLQMRVTRAMPTLRRSLEAQGITGF